MNRKKILFYFLLIWFISQLFYIGIINYIPLDIQYRLIGQINLIERPLMVILITLILCLISFLPGYILLHISHIPRNWITAFLLSLVFNLILGVLLSSIGWFNPIIIIPVYLSVLLTSLCLFSAKPFEISWIKFLEKYSRTEYIFFYIIFILFMIYPRWHWSVEMHGPWPGDPVDRLARATLLTQGFSIWADIIPGRMTWYPPLWNILMALTHYLTGFRLYSVTSASSLFFGIILFLLIFQFGRKYFGYWGGNLLCLLTILLKFYAYSEFQGMMTPAGFADILFILIILTLYLSKENRYYLLLSGLCAGLALMTYPKTGFICFAYFLLYYVFILNKNEKYRLTSDYFSGLAISILLALIYWLPFTIQYGISPPEESWLRLQFKVATVISSFSDIYKYLLQPYWLDYIFIFLIIYFYIYKKRFSNINIAYYSLMIYLGQYALRWHHLITEPLLGFSVQPDRFDRYAGVSRGILYASVLYFIYQYLDEIYNSINFPEKYRWGNIAYLFAPIVTVILLILMLFISPFNQYYDFLQKLLNPERIEFTHPFELSLDMEPAKFLQDDSLMAIKFHPYFQPKAIQLGLWFKEKTPKNSVVLAPLWNSWYHIAGLGGRRVFVNLPPYHGPMDTSQPMRKQIMEEIYTSHDIYRLEKLIRENQIDYICKFGEQYENHPFGRIFDLPSLVPVFGLDRFVTVYKYKPRTAPPEPVLTIFGENAGSIVPWVNRFKKANYFLELPGFDQNYWSPMEDIYKQSDIIILVNMMNHAQSFELEQLIEFVRLGKRLVLIGNTAYGLYQRYGNKIEELTGFKEIQLMELSESAVLGHKSIYQQQHYITQDFPAYSNALIIPNNTPVYIGREPTDAKPIGWLSKDADGIIFSENRLGDGKVIFWGLNYYQMGESKQITLLHRLAEYLRLDEPEFIPLSMQVKKSKILPQNIDDSGILSRNIDIIFNQKDLYYRYRTKENN